MWGKLETKKNEEMFKLTHLELEPNRENLEDPSLLNFYEYINQIYKEKTEDELPEENVRVSYNSEMRDKKIKCIMEVSDQGNPGVKFKKHIEDMRKKLRVDEKIVADYGIKVESKKYTEKMLVAA